MNAVDRLFTLIINGSSQFVIPVFQRDYTWSEANCEQLWKDVLRVGANGTRHFLGSFVYVPTSDSAAGFTRWMLIDGQQRLTTLTLLMIALRDHIKKIKNYNPGEQGPTVKRLDAYFLKNVQEEGDRLYKLVLRRNDQLALKALVDGKDVTEGVSERIQDNYEFFCERLKDTDPTTVFKGVGQLVVVDVTLGQGDDPQLIFESLNSTGVDLSQSDLIRNFILMRLPEREQTRLFEAYWSKIEGLFRGHEGIFDSFARDYVALQTQASKQEKAGDIYQGFRNAFDGWLQLLAGLNRCLKTFIAMPRTTPRLR